MKTVVLSGAGSGIGRATARVLEGAAGPEGVRLLLVGRSRAKLEETRAQTGNAAWRTSRDPENQGGTVVIGMPRAKCVGES